MEKSKILKIAVVGPESTGKSTMSAYLAKHYKTVWVPEFARGYCENLTAPPTWQDEINMFYGQVALEKEIIAQANELLICDTTFLTVKIWSDEIFGKSPQEVLDALPNHQYDLYLLLNIDLAWEDDPLRDFPDKREHFMAVWYKKLDELKANYVVISGTGQDRYDNAVAAIDGFLARNNIPHLRSGEAFCLIFSTDILPLTGHSRFLYGQNLVDYILGYVPHLRSGELFV